MAVDFGIRELIGKVVATAAMMSVAEAVNTGREEGFADIVEEIGAFQWSAILDDRTCANCEDLDGKYFDQADPQLDYIKPPLHIGCRCILVAVLKEELANFPVKVTHLTNDQVDALTISKL